MGHDRFLARRGAQRDAVASGKNLDNARKLDKPVL